MICCLILEPNLMIGSSCNIGIYPKCFCWAWEEWAGNSRNIGLFAFCQFRGRLFDEKGMCTTIILINFSSLLLIDPLLFLPPHWNLKFLPKLGYVSSSKVAIQDAYHRCPLDTYKISLLLLIWQGRLKVQSDILSVPIIIPGADDVGQGAGQVQMVTRGGHCIFHTVQGYGDLDRVWKVEERELEGVSLFPPSFFFPFSS